MTEPSLPDKTGQEYKTCVHTENVTMCDEFSVKPAISQKILSDHELTEDGKESHRCVINTDLKFRWTATQRTVTLAATGWGGPTSTWRKKQALSFSRGDGQRLFLTLLKV